MLVFFLLIFNLYYERFNLWTMKNPSITVKCPLFSKVFLEVLGLLCELLVVVGYRLISY